MPRSLSPKHRLRGSFRFCFSSQKGGGAGLGLRLRHIGTASLRPVPPMHRHRGGTGGERPCHGPAQRPGQRPYGSPYQYMRPGSYTCCISNPPYFAAGPQSKAHPTARQEVHCTLEDVFRSAGWALRYGGDFYLVHRPERFAEACSCASRHGMEVKKVCLLRHKPHDPISLTLLSCRKGGKPGLNWEEMCLFREDGTPTDDYRRLYHL